MSGTPLEHVFFVSCLCLDATDRISLMLLFCVITTAKKNQVSQANKLKREERLNEIDDLLQNNKELQEQIMQKLDEARALNATTEVENLPYLFSKEHRLSMHNTLIFTCLK